MSHFIRRVSLPADIRLWDPRFGSGLGRSINCPPGDRQTVAGKSGFGETRVDHERCHFRRCRRDALSRSDAHAVST